MDIPSGSECALSNFRLAIKEPPVEEKAYLENSINISYTWQAAFAGDLSCRGSLGVLLCIKRLDSGVLTVRYYFRVKSPRCDVCSSEPANAETIIVLPDRSPLCCYLW